MQSTGAVRGKVIDILVSGFPWPVECAEVLAAYMLFNLTWTKGTLEFSYQVEAIGLLNTYCSHMDGGNISM